ncbi:MAG: DUF4494 domain-containing protein [Candidatus Auribacterota bacterium]|jgi:hypothetical protein|nr:DUF4494 domain-containing protein [Candidatus Auribacterota bacterium]
MQIWFETKVKYLKVDEEGRERKVTEMYMLDAVSFTDAEARITQLAKEFTRGDFTISDIKQSNVTEILYETNGQWWYKAKINLVTIDEKAGKEKKISEYFLVSANSIDEALKTLNEGLSYILVPFTVVSVALTQVCDVFQYFSMENETDQPDTE